MDNREVLSQVVVQLLGFLAVLWVMKTFAWKKLLGVMDERKEKIRSSFADLEKQKADLEALEKEYRLKLDGIEKEARQKIQEAAVRGSELAKDIQEKAHEESHKMVERARAEIEQDLMKAKVSMRDEVVEIAARMAEKVLSDKLTEADHRRLVEQFVREIEKI